MPVETISGTDGSDLLFGTDADNLILGGAGDDYIVTEGGLDTVYGEGDNDVILTNSGGAYLYGGDGDDTLSTSDHLSTVAGSLFGGAGNDQLYAGDHRDRCFGGDGDDTISVTVFQFGLARGGAGQDHLDLRFVNKDLQPNGANISVLLNGPDAGVHIGDTGIFTISGFESLSVKLGSGDDTVRGGNLADSLVLGRGMNTAHALDGDDLVSYQTGAVNTLDGGRGFDTLQVIQAESGQPLIFRVDHGAATDQFGSVITGFEAYDISGSAVNDRVVLGAGADIVQLGLGADRAFGLGGDDWLYGGQGRDFLFGGPGNDLLVGGAGIDVLNGGAGVDEFMFLDLRHGGDLILDFDPAEDVIVIGQAAIQYGLPTGPVSSERFFLDSASGTPAQFVYRAGSTPGESELIWDSNGDSAGGEVQIARFLGDPLLVSYSILIL